MDSSENYPGFEYMEGVRGLFSGQNAADRIKADFQAFYRSRENPDLLEDNPDQDTVYEFFSRAGDVARSHDLTDRQSDRVFDQIRDALNKDKSRTGILFELFRRPLAQNNVYGVPESELYDEFKS